MIYFVCRHPGPGAYIFFIAVFFTVLYLIIINKVLFLQNLRDAE